MTPSLFRYCSSIFPKQPGKLTHIPITIIIENIQPGELSEHKFSLYKFNGGFPFKTLDVGYHELERQFKKLLCPKNITTSPKTKLLSSVISATEKHLVNLVACILLPSDQKPGQKTESDKRSIIGLFLPCVVDFLQN